MHETERLKLYQQKIVHSRSTAANLAIQTIPALSACRVVRHEQYNDGMKKGRNGDQPVLFLLLLPTWAWKPVLIAFTDRLEPQDSQATKKIRFSFVSRVSGDLHVLHVTYSTEQL